MSVGVCATGYCVSVSPRGERSALARVLTPDQLIQFTCPRGMGGGRRSFPLASSTGILCRFDFSRKSPSYPWMCTSFIPQGPSPFRESNLAVNAAFSLANETVSKFFQPGPSQLYSGYDSFVKLVSKNECWAGLLNLLIEEIGELGVTPVTRACADCGREGKLVAFSLEAGGFLCPDCAPSHRDCFTGRENLLTLRYLFETPIESREVTMLKGELIPPIARSCIRYLVGYFGVQILGLELFDAVVSR